MATGRSLLSASLALCAGLAIGCGDASRATAPATPVATLEFTGAAPAQLIECPTDTTIRATRTIGLLGGTISAGGTTIKIPVGAVLLPTEFELVIPASKYMEIAVHGGGLPHFEFLAPVQVSIDYSRCPASALGHGPLSVYYIDEGSKQLLERMGVIGALGKVVTFGTDHFSGYAIAN